MYFKPHPVGSIVEGFDQLILNCGTKGLCIQAVKSKKFISM